MYCEKCGTMNDKNAQYCKRCGAKMKYSNNKNKGIKNLLKYLIILILIIIIIFIIYKIVNLNKSNVWFSDEATTTETAQSTELKKNNDEENDENNGNNNQNKKTETTTKSSYKTTIVDDNYYSNIKIENKEDVEELIEEDSVSQKDNTEEEIKEIEDEIINNYKVKAVNLGEIDLETAKGIEKVVEYIYVNYPTARSYLTNITINNTGISEDYVAAFGPAEFASSPEVGKYAIGNKTIVHLNSKYFLNVNYLESAMESSSNSGHFPKNANKYSSVIHEFGHYMMFLVTMKKYGLNDYTYIDENTMEKASEVLKDWCNNDSAVELLQEAYNNYTQKYNDNLTFDEFRASISGYAMAKDNDGEYIYHETVAEAFHDYYLNGDNAAKASIEIMNVLNKRLEEI